MASPPPNPTPPATASAVAAAARRTRAEMLFAVADGLFSVADVIESSAEPGNEAILRLRLVALLSAQPEVSTATAHTIVRRMLAALGEPASTRRLDLTVAWLVDPRASGRRVLAFNDALHRTGRTAPWPGFPYAPAPDWARVDDSMTQVVVGR